ncbi:hypothetical protein RGQ13_12790 [Thalassotalea psychrophila]|uniref:Uncharacterized protein n=1 Tax=Thalassotalea psychrophila TaxID=3065647 RepID=A0ABY9TRF1_9GAMM|nr:hypothetical protein RGQ13_12790 [Colwelliaceae bacterium SQ149]
MNILQKIQNNNFTNPISSIIFALFSIWVAIQLAGFLGSIEMPFNTSGLSILGVAIQDIIVLGTPYFLLFSALTIIGFKYLIKPTKLSVILFLLIVTLPCLLLMKVSYNSSNYYLFVNDSLPIIGVILGLYILKTKTLKNL